MRVLIFFLTIVASNVYSQTNLKGIWGNENIIVDFNTKEVFASNQNRWQIVKLTEKKLKCKKFFTDTTSNKLLILEIHSVQDDTIRLKPKRKSKGLILNQGEREFIYLFKLSERNLFDINQVTIRMRISNIKDSLNYVSLDSSDILINESFDCYEKCKKILERKYQNLDTGSFIFSDTKRVLYLGVFYNDILLTMLSQDLRQVKENLFNDCW